MKQSMLLLISLFALCQCAQSLDADYSDLRDVVSNVSGRQLLQTGSQFPSQCLDFINNLDVGKGSLWDSCTASAFGSNPEPCPTACSTFFKSFPAGCLQPWLDTLNVVLAQQFEGQPPGQECVLVCSAKIGGGCPRGASAPVPAKSPSPSPTPSPAPSGPTGTVPSNGASCASFNSAFDQCLNFRISPDSNSTDTCPPICSKVFTGSTAAPVECQRDFVRAVSAGATAKGLTACLTICGQDLGSPVSCRCREWYLGAPGTKDYPGRKCDSDILDAIAQGVGSFCSPACGTILGSVTGCTEWFGQATTGFLEYTGEYGSVTVCDIPVGGGVSSTPPRAPPRELLPPSPSIIVFDSPPPPKIPGPVVFAGPPDPPFFPVPPPAGSAAQAAKYYYVMLVVCWFSAFLVFWV